MQKQPHIEWVTAYTEQNLSEAYSMAGCLKKAGIAHFIKPDSIGKGYSNAACVHAEVEVFVNEDNYENAVDVLSKEL